MVTSSKSNLAALSSPENVMRLKKRIVSLENAIKKLQVYKLDISLHQFLIKITIMTCEEQVIG